MVVLLIPALLYLVSIGFRSHGSRGRAVIDGTVLLFALAVAVAELTSLFAAYNLLWVSLCWGLIDCLLGVYQYRVFHIASPFGKGLFAVRGDIDKQEKILLFLIAGTVAFAFLRVLLSPPTIPSDATVYHQPRTFMFYKNQSIHNFACSKGHMLYFGPLNAILMSQLQILCFGWDGLSPMVQLSAYLLSMVCVYQISLLLCKNRKYALVGMAFVCFMPMAHLQAATMQSDLLVTALCAAAVSLMVRTYTELKAGAAVDNRRFALLGFCCGLAVLAKLSAGATLVGFALLYMLLLLVKRRGRAVRDGLLILLCALMMTGGYWTRNALDWKGDFLPVSYAGSRPDYQRLGVRGTVLISAKAIANTFADPTKDTLPVFRVFGTISSACANVAANLLGMELDEPLTREGSCMYTGWTHPTADQISYPLHGLMVMVLLPAAVIYGIVKRKWWLLGYGLCCAQAIAVTSTQYLWNASYNRYLMPAFVLTLPLCVFMLQRLACVGRTGRGIKGLTAALVAGMFVINAIPSGYFALKFGKDIFVEGHTHDERVLAEHEYHPLALWREVLRDVEENQYTKIGLGPGAQGDYIWMRPFAYSKFQVKYINAEVRPDLEEPDYLPDCMIMQERGDVIPETMTYHGAIYERRFDPAPAFGRLETDTTRFVYYARAD